MQTDDSTARDYVISREGDALLATDHSKDGQFNPEVANDILVTESDPVSSEFNDIYLDSYTKDCVADIRDQVV